MDTQLLEDLGRAITEVNKKLSLAALSGYDVSIRVIKEAEVKSLASGKTTPIYQIDIEDE